ncbi:hypothetical protein GQ43DRAFT_359047, partial [Delitschia confertaspora ATCC 74209]
RTLESSTFPVLRQNCIQFMAYSPLVDGFLTSHLILSPPFSLIETSFEKSFHNPKFGLFYRYWYDKPPMHAAVGELKAMSESYDVGMVDMRMRRLIHHSEL